MSAPPSVDDVARALGVRWRQRPPAVGMAVDVVRPTRDAIEVAFRWRRDPQPYLLRVPYPDTTTEALGEAFDVADAVDELDRWLEEELGTGLVSWAERHRSGDRVLLGPRTGGTGSWFVSDVPLEQPGDLAARIPDGATRVAARWGRTASSTPIADPGRHLDEAGLDGADGREAAADGSLLLWLQVGGGEPEDPSVGQAVVVRDRGVARILRLEVLGTRPGAFDALAWVACRRAVEAGALQLVAPRHATGLLGFGFRRRAQGLVARFGELRRPAAPS